METVNMLKASNKFTIGFRKLYFIFSLIGFKFT